MLKGVSPGYLLWYFHSKVFWYFHEQGMCTFHWAFLDDRPPLTSLAFPCVELLGYGCCLTAGHWAFKTQMQPGMDCCQI